MDSDLISLADRLLACSHFSWRAGQRILGGPFVAHVSEDGLNTIFPSRPGETGWLEFASGKIRPDLGDPTTLEDLEVYLLAAGGALKSGDCTTRAERLVEAYEDLELDSMEDLASAPLKERIRFPLFPAPSRGPGEWSFRSEVPAEPVELEIFVREGRGALLHSAWVAGGPWLTRGAMWLPPGRNQVCLASTRSQFWRDRDFRVKFAYGDVEHIYLSALRVEESALSKADEPPLDLGAAPSAPAPLPSQEHDLICATHSLRSVLQQLGMFVPSSLPSTAEVRILARALELEIEQRGAAPVSDWDLEVTERCLRELRKMLRPDVETDAETGPAPSSGHVAMELVALIGGLLQEIDKKDASLRVIARLTGGLE